MLRKLVDSADVRIPLPEVSAFPTSNITVASITPEEIRIERDSKDELAPTTATLVLRGSNLDRLETAPIVTVNGKTIEGARLDPTNGDVGVVTVTLPKDSKGVLLTKLKEHGGSYSTMIGPVMVKSASKPDGLEPQLKLEQKGPGGVAETTVYAQKGVVLGPDAKALVQSEIEKNKPAAAPQCQAPEAKCKTGTN